MKNPRLNQSPPNWKNNQQPPRVSIHTLQLTISQGPSQLQRTNSSPSQKNNWQSHAQLRYNYAVLQCRKIVWLDRSTSSSVWTGNMVWVRIDWKGRWKDSDSWQFCASYEDRYGRNSVEMGVTFDSGIPSSYVIAGEHCGDFHGATTREVILTEDR